MERDYMAEILEELEREEESEANDSIPSEVLCYYEEWFQDFCQQPYLEGIKNEGWKRVLGQLLERR